ncbi:hypothetical protein DAH62_15600, partial [Sphingomonas koreensis]
EPGRGAGLGAGLGGRLVELRGLAGDQRLELFDARLLFGEAALERVEAAVLRMRGKRGGECRRGEKDGTDTHRPTPLRAAFGA